MRRNLSVALAFVIALGGVALGQNGPARTISVSGTVEAKTAPDRIVWRISLRDTDQNLREAKNRNDEKAKAVVALREKLGIGKGDLETGHVSVRREYERDQHGRQGDFKHFVVSRSVTIRQRDLKRFDEFLDSFVSSAEMEVYFNFESSRIHEVRAETRLKAMQAAKDKAEAMARAVGAKRGRVLTINEHAPGQRWQSPGSNMGYVHSTPPVDLATDTFVPGAVDVRVTVYVTFELQ